MQSLEKLHVRRSPTFVRAHAEAKTNLACILGGRMSSFWFLPNESRNDPQRRTNCRYGNASPTRSLQRVGDCGREVDNMTKYPAIWDPFCARVLTIIENKLPISAECRGTHRPVSQQVPADLRCNVVC